MVKSHELICHFIILYLVTLPTYEQVWNHFSSRSFSDLNVIGLDANVIFQTIGMVIGGRHPGFYFLDEAETSDLVGTNTKPHYYIVGPSQISFFFFTFYQPLPKWVVIKLRQWYVRRF